MEWQTNSSVWHPPYNKRCVIKLFEGGYYIATLIHFNPQFTRNAPDRWRREDEVPKKSRWIDDEQVAKWLQLDK